MDKALLIQLGGSAAGIAVLVGFTAWMGVARPTPPQLWFTLEHGWPADDGETGARRWPSAHAIALKA